AAAHESAPRWTTWAESLPICMHCPPRPGRRAVQTASYGLRSHAIHAHSATPAGSLTKRKGAVMSSGPWYRDGLRFQCTQCGDCCAGAPGYVWVNRQEIEQLAAAVGCEDIDAFCEQYTRKVGVRRSLKEYPNGDCVFF